MVWSSGLCWWEVGGIRKVRLNIYEKGTYKRNMRVDRWQEGRVFSKAYYRKRVRASGASLAQAMSWNEIVSSKY